jgi:hypothetical protein
VRVCVTVCVCVCVCVCVRTREWPVWAMYARACAFGVSHVSVAARGHAYGRHAGGGGARCEDDDEGGGGASGYAMWAAGAASGSARGAGLTGAFLGDEYYLDEEEEAAHGFGGVRYGGEFSGSEGDDGVDNEDYVDSGSGGDDDDEDDGDEDDDDEDDEDDDDDDGSADGDGGGGGGGVGDGRKEGAEEAGGATATVGDSARSPTATSAEGGVGAATASGGAGIARRTKP